MTRIVRPRIIYWWNKNYYLNTIWIFTSQHWIQHIVCLLQFESSDWVHKTILSQSISNKLHKQSQQHPKLFNVFLIIFNTTTSCNNLDKCVCVSRATITYLHNHVFFSHIIYVHTSNDSVFVLFRHENFDISQRTKLRTRPLAHAPRCNPGQSTSWRNQFGETQIYDRVVNLR